VSGVCCHVEVCLLCVVGWLSLIWADHSSRGFLPSVVCLSVIVKIRLSGDSDPLNYLLKIVFFRMSQLNQRPLPLMRNHKLSKNVYVEMIRLIFKR
jgi:hypothetical protein